MVTQFTGSDEIDTLSGTSGDDLIYGYDPNGPQGDVSTIAGTLVATASAPVYVGAPPGDVERLFIVEKNGLINILDLGTGVVQSTPFLDVSAEIDASGEQGLLGLTFDPDFAHNGYFYVNLINTSGDTEIRRYQVSASDPNVADPASSTLIISVDQPAGSTSHKAGWLGFGPDGDLYVALGDGGTGGAPAQDPNDLLGKILRLDVSADAFPGDPTRNYTIPADNPFVGTGAAEEIYALGLRNPWRDSFDRALGTLFIADVGQNQWEEIDLGASGANYGWPIFEGPAVFAGGSLTLGTLTAPIFSYDHTVGQAITGGYVYRGPDEGLQGQYFYADYVTGKIWTLELVGTEWVATERTDQIVYNTGSPVNPASFGEDGLGNLYVVDVSGGGIYRLDPQTVSADLGDTLSGGDANDFIYGGSGDDLISGGAGINSLFGMDGNDTIIVSIGINVVDGGLGTDRLIVDYSSATTNFEAAITGGTLAIGYTGFVSDEAGNITTFANIENLIIALGSGDDVVNLAAGADVVDGGAGHDTINTGDGDDLLTGGPGPDDLNGGPGNDTASYALSALAVNVSLTFGLGSGGDAEGDTLAEIENLIGSGNADILTGDGNPNRLDGALGADVLIGALGDDTYVVDSPGDVIVEGPGDVNDTVEASFDFTLPDNLESLVLTGNAVTGIGNSAANHITGNSLDNILDAGGNDVVAGKTGDDTYIVAGFGDQVIEAPDEGRDAVYVPFDNYVLPDNLETLVLFGNAAFGFGNSADNTIYGDDLDNIVDDGGGIDTMFGRLGDDTYSVTNAAALVVENPDEGRDAIYTTVNFVLPAEVETLVLTGSAIVGTGNAAANSIYGNSLNNLLRDGGGGADSLFGKAGNDAYVVSSALVGVVEEAGEGFDTVLFRGKAFTLPDNVEGLTLIGSAIIGNGNELNNRVTGNSLGNVLDGRAGADTLKGAAGADAFIFSPGEASGDSLVDFSGDGAGTGDTLQFVGYGSADDGASFQQLDAVNWLVSSADGLTQEVITLLNGASVNPNDVFFL